MSARYRPESESLKAARTSQRKSHNGIITLRAEVARLTAGLDRLMVEREVLRGKLADVTLALDRSRIALDDWLNDFAHDMCDSARVAEARERIMEFGTIGYIANVQEQNRAALKAATEEPK